MKWKKNTASEVLNGKDFYISFNPNKKHILGIDFNADTDIGETALCNKGK